jgi:hypothetical protein
MQMSRWTEADAHFARAAEQNQRMGAKPWVAYTQVSHAAMLRARGGPGDEARAAELLARARALARELGMTSLLRKMEKTRDGQAGPPSSASTERPMRELARDSVAAGSAGGDAASEAYVLRHEGEHWTARFGNEITRLRDAKGLHYLAHLLRHPGEEFHVLEIVGGALESGLDALDSEDRDAVRGRLAELDEQLADAHAIGDSARALRFEEEIDTLARRVAGAVGHAHGERRAGSAGERARINVTRAIKGVLQKLDESSPALAGHLRRTIRTGTFCSYNPDPRVPIHWAS